EHASVLRPARLEQDAGAASVRPDDASRHWVGVVSDAVLCSRKPGTAKRRSRRRAKISPRRRAADENFLRIQKETYTDGDVKFDMVGDGSRIFVEVLI